jgi:AraC-like DNA-binding protein
LSESVLIRHSKSIVHEFSNTAKVDLNWLQYLIGGMALVWCIVILSDVIKLSLFHNLPVTMDDLIYYSVVIFTVCIGFFGIRQTDIFRFTGALSENVRLEHQKPVSERYPKSGLKDAAAAELHGNLQLVMTAEKPFLDSDITLYELARSMNVHPNHLSQVINEKCNTNFCDFINRLRIEEFKNRINEISEKKENILSLALDCDFNSKSSFNSIFKKLTGTTPREYLKSDHNK